MLGLTMNAPEQYKTQLEPFACPWPGGVCAGEDEIANRGTNRNRSQHRAKVIE
jgi:hypothetical protein